ncbi:hypothetical protein MMC12_006460 [Toensbergia leucococca]|nr:hypothetical protein [Toensbergia leucococca]
MHSSIPTSLYNVVIKDSTGKDISASVEVLHHHHILSSKTQKRSTFRTINECPTGYSFVRSTCNRRRSPQAWQMTCIVYALTGYHIPTVVVSEACTHAEICVDAATNAERRQTALCISFEDFIKYAQTRLEHSSLTDVTHLSNIASTSTSFMSASIAPSLYSVDAVMTGRDPHQTLWASSMKIEAQKFSMVHSQPLWQTIAGGAAQCEDCASVGIDAVPLGTQRLSVTTALQVGSSIGFLYLTTFQTT